MRAPGRVCPWPKQRARCRASPVLRRTSPWVRLDRLSSRRCADPSRGRRRRHSGHHACHRDRFHLRLPARIAFRRHALHLPALLPGTSSTSRPEPLKRRAPLPARSLSSSSSRHRPVHRASTLPVSLEPPRQPLAKSPARRHEARLRSDPPGNRWVDRRRATEAMRFGSGVASTPVPRVVAASSTTQAKCWSRTSHQMRLRSGRRPRLRQGPSPIARRSTCAVARMATTADPPR